MAIDFISINPKYKRIIDKLEKENRVKFLAMVARSGWTGSRYTNYFFPATSDYHQQFHSAKEISDYVGEYKYQGSTLIKFARMGLMEIEEGCPNKYCLPFDFFLTNDLSITFKGDKEMKIEDF